MTGVSEVLGDAGEPVYATLTDGRRLKVRKFVQSDKSKLEQRLKKITRDDLFEFKDTMSDDEYRLTQEAFGRLSASGAFSFNSSTMRTWLAQPESNHFVIRMLCSWADGKEVTESDMVAIGSSVDDLKAIGTAVGQVLSESFPNGKAKP